MKLGWTAQRYNVKYDDGIEYLVYAKNALQDFRNEMSRGKYNMKKYCEENNMM
jgi:hypothetical protein